MFVYSVNRQSVCMLNVPIISVFLCYQINDSLKGLSVHVCCVHTEALTSIFKPCDGHSEL